MSLIDLKLPASLVTKHQFIHFLNDFEIFDEAMTAYEIKASTGAENNPMPAEDQRITQFLGENNLASNDSGARANVVETLRSIRKVAPIVHMTFSAEADPASLADVAAWFRETMHPHALLEVGLQPHLVAGAYIRSQNKVYDYSLRARIVGQRASLVEALRAAQ